VKKTQILKGRKLKVEMSSNERTVLASFGKLKQVTRAMKIAHINEKAERNPVSSQSFFMRC
jgi:hypothetical protein